MKSIRISAAIAATIISLGASALVSGSAAADAPALYPIEITQLCADPSNNQVYWNVNNKNSSDVIINWTALDNGHTGSFDAPAGYSQLASYYDLNDHNNTTQFQYTAIDTSQASGTQSDSFSTNSTNTVCAPGQVTPVAPPTTGGGTTNPGSGSTDTPPTTGGTGGGNPGQPTPVDTTTPSNPTTGTTGGATAPTMSAPVVTPPVTTGGKGGGDLGQATANPVVVTPVATPTQLAYTGASRLLPYTAAAILALFTATTSILVRKNVL